MQSWYLAVRPGAQPRYCGKASQYGADQAVQVGGGGGSGGAARGTRIASRSFMPGRIPYWGAMRASRMARTMAISSSVWGVPPRLSFK